MTCDWQYSRVPRVAGLVPTLSSMSWTCSVVPQCSSQLPCAGKQDTQVLQKLGLQDISNRVCLEKPHTHTQNSSYVDLCLPSCNIMMTWLWLSRRWPKWLRIINQIIWNTDHYSHYFKQCFLPSMHCTPQSVTWFNLNQLGHHSISPPLATHKGCAFLPGFGTGLLVCGVHAALCTGAKGRLDLQLLYQRLLISSNYKRWSTLPHWMKIQVSNILWILVFVSVMQYLASDFMHVCLCMRLRELEGSSAQH